MSLAKLSIIVIGMFLLNGAVGEEHHDCAKIAFMEPGNEACSVKCSYSDLASIGLIRNCPYLQKLYGYGDGISTGVNGVGLYSLPTPTVEFQRLISDAEDGDTIILSGGYCTENNISIDKNLTIYRK